MTHPRHKRARLLVAPRFQLRVVGVFLLLSLGSILVQLFLMGVDLRLIGQSLPPGNALDREVAGVLTRALLFSAGMWIPITLGVGILITHRIAGPIHRFEQHLEAVARGEAIGPCRIRRGDEFQGLCDRLNAALSAQKAVKDRPATRRAA